MKQIEKNTLYLSCDQVMLPASVPLYSRLHPPGWCLVQSLEQRHQDTWTGLRSRLLEADTMAMTLLQMLVIIQVSEAL